MWLSGLSREASRPRAMLAASHHRRPGVRRARSPSLAAQGFPREGRLPLPFTAAPSSRRVRAPRRPPARARAPRCYLRTPRSVRRSPARPPRRVRRVRDPQPGRRRPGAAGFAPRRARGAPTGSGQPRSSLASAPRRGLPPPSAPTPFVVTSSQGNGAARLPPPLRDPAPRWLRPKPSPPYVGPGSRKTCQRRPAPPRGSAPRPPFVGVPS